MNNQSREKINIDIVEYDPEKSILKYSQFGNIQTNQDLILNYHTLKKIVANYLPIVLKIKKYGKN